MREPIPSVFLVGSHRHLARVRVLEERSVCLQQVHNHEKPLQLGRTVSGVHCSLLVARRQPDRCDQNTMARECITFLSAASESEEAY